MFLSEPKLAQILKESNNF